MSAPGAGIERRLVGCGDRLGHRRNGVDGSLRHPLPHLVSSEVVSPIELVFRPGHLEG